MESLTASEKKFLLHLSTPQKIQEYLESIPFNHEEDGETCMSVRDVIRNGKAHCLEGAFLACASLILQGRPAFIVSLKVTRDDYDHVITLYKEHGYWGAISKTNHAVLGYRDPVYKTIRELAMSYFHEYFLATTGEKTLRGYSRIISMKRFGSSWITATYNLFTIAEAIADAPYSMVIPQENKKYIRHATKIEKAASLISWDNLSS